MSVAYQSGSSEWVSKPSSSASTTRIPRLALMRCAASTSCWEMSVEGGVKLYAGLIRCASCSKSISVLSMRSPRVPSPDDPIPMPMSASNMRASEGSERSTPNASPMLSGSDDAFEIDRPRGARSLRRATRRRTTTRGGVRQRVEIAAEPTGRGRGAAAPTVHPDVGRREVAQVGRLVTDAAHDRDLARVEAGLQLRERRVQREPVADGRPFVISIVGRRPRVGGSPTGATMLSPSLPPARKIVMRMPWLSATTAVPRTPRAARCTGRPRRQPRPSRCPGGSDAGRHRLGSKTREIRQGSSPGSASPASAG